jgi:tRNA (mo5U34)-methyltransferase
MTDVLQKRRSEDFSAELLKIGWYHSMELPGDRVIHGFLSLEELRERFAEFPLPPDLSGKRVLDIGTWDGWFAFEAERRGAEVVAVDNIEQENFYYARRELGSRVVYDVAEVYELRERKLAPFDYTFFLGVLYHLRHPLLALEIVCELTTDIAIVDSFIVDDDYRGATGASPIPWMEFYETTELSNQVDNWVGPTLECLLALCRSAGFARAELFNVKHRHARVACYRHWEPPPEPAAAEAPVLRAALNGRWGDNGINFNTRKEEFLTYWFTSSETDLRREDLRPEVSGYGAPALALLRDSEHEWHASIHLPPGLQPGWHDVRLRTVRSGFSNTCPIAVDMSVKTTAIAIVDVCDGRTWQPGEVQFRPDEKWGFLVLWIRGLAANCDRNNVRVYSESQRLPVDFVSSSETSGVRQVNARIPALLKEETTVFVDHGGHRSEPSRVRLRTDDQ